MAQRTEYWSFLLSQAGYSTPDLENCWISPEKTLFNGRSKGHDCDTENMPLIGRIQGLSSADIDTLWWRKPYLSF